MDNETRRKATNPQDFYGTGICAGGRRRKQWAAFENKRTPKTTGIQRKAGRLELCMSKSLHRNAHKSSICSNQKLGSAQMSFEGWLVKLIVVYSTRNTIQQHKGVNH